MNLAQLDDSMRRLAADRPLRFAGFCLVLYAGYGWLGQSAKLAGSRAGAMGAELLACVLAALILTGLGWWRRTDFAPPRWRNLWVVLPFLLYLAGGYRGVVTSPLQTVGYGLSALLIGFQEEAWLRGIFLETFRPRYGAYGAVLLSSLAFGLLHLANLVSGGAVADVILQVLMTLLFGLIFAGIRLRTGSMWVPVILHTLVDFFSFVGTSAGTGMEPMSPTVMIIMAVLILAYGVALLWGIGKRGSANQ